MPARNAFTRRDLLKVAASAAVTVPLWGRARAAEEQSMAPAITKGGDALNILYLHCHDAGRMLGPYQPAVPTPSLRALAKEAFRFSNAHCAAPTCSPSRSAMLTGLTAHESGMLGLAHRGFALDHPERHLAAWLHQAGYHTALSGIQHEFGPKAKLPYDEVLAPARAPELSRDLRVARAAADWLAKKPNGPFFLSVGFFWPHREWPVAEPGTVADPAAFPVRLPDEPRVRQDLANYYAAARVMDTAAGWVLDALARSGLRERTIVLFTTDHGVPLPGGKCQMHDAGTGVSLLLDFPGSKVRGQTTASLVSHLDVFPTLCDLAHVPAPPWLQGHSLRPLFDDPGRPHRDAVFSEVNWHAAYEPTRSVRTTKWRYVRRYQEYHYPVLANIDDSPSKDAYLDTGAGRVPVPPEELYSYAPDGTESPNVLAAPQNAAALADLRSRLDRWMKETNDPLLTHPLPLKPPHGTQINRLDDRSPKLQPEQF